MPGEVYSSLATTHEPMGTVEYGWGGFEFLDLAVWDNATIWALWDTRTSPCMQCADSPYSYTPYAQWYHFGVQGP